jgi:hypothetical protein
VEAVEEESRNGEYRANLELMLEGRNSKTTLTFFFSVSHPLSNLLIKNSAEARDIGSRGAGIISPCRASTPRAIGGLFEPL